ncbi:MULTISPECIES: restriction endonuclease subunit S [Vibrio harveyi group]|uniref:restriction endonuclease subunit S n=1 Tax=Vibrio harveyi group TaxID=717610 RepID=UPI001BD2CDCB|nr:MULTISPECIES: restriction endonuclease subunit S [Vibrio harveyi group]MBS9857269.1 restriction endonuclease subunit S [Vibrio alginolyticus]MCZ0924990.1 restriction endonuclease subunit S [Vibrio diabolicus]MDV5036990.1 restriction endonuclease subunit S [Vibrio diabolicus]
MSYDPQLLEDYLELVTYGFTNPMPDSDTGPWKVTAKDVINGEINYSTARRTTQEAFDTKLTKKSRPKLNDVLLTKDGTLGRLAIVRELGLCVNQSVAILRPNKKIIPEYLFYLLSTPEYQRKMIGDSDGTVIKHIYITRVGKMEVNIPPINLQQERVRHLQAIDRKLKINTQMNQTLEEMAQAIFKSWFIDFDPVKAKMNGEQPEGMDEATASLFPEKLVESELGLIPEGWESKQLKDVLELAYGKALKKTDRVAGGVPVYGSGGLTGYHNQSLVEGPGIIVGRKGTVGSVYWEPRAFYPIDTVFYVKPRAGYSLKYCHLVLQNLGLKDMNTDAAVPGLNRNNAYRLDVVTPSEAVLDKFEEIMQSFQSKVDANNAQNSNLESLRDTLLPKLLSGEVEL